MTTLKRSRIIICILFMLVACFVLFVEIKGRCKVLSDYYKLLSANNAKQYLNYVPETQILKHADFEESISVGCVSFVFPFDEIQTIEESGEGSGRVITSEKILLKVLNS